MYFCYRQATGFRKNKERGYRIGYAYSTDLVNWEVLSDALPALPSWVVLGANAAGAIEKLLRCLINIVDIQDDEDRRAYDQIAILDGIATWEKLTGKDAVTEFNIQL